MNPCLALMESLRRHPDLTYRESPGSVKIEAPTPDGFAVELRDDGDDEWTVHLGSAGFHEPFTSAEEALNFIAWCYSGSARLREMWRGTVPEKAVLEAYEDGRWQPILETKFIFVPNWRSRRETILQNPKILKD